MRYHNITKDDMLNGDGLRVVLWSAGCEHHCVECQNPITWNPEGGLLFDDKARQEIFEQLNEEYISGITFSGGDPLYTTNREYIDKFIREIKTKYPNKTIWIYTGYVLEYEDNKFWLISKNHGKEATTFPFDLVNVVVDGRFEKDKADTKYHWAGSTNQRVIDIQETLKKGAVVLWNS